MADLILDFYTYFFLCDCVPWRLDFVLLQIKGRVKNLA